MPSAHFGGAVAVVAADGLIEQLSWVAEIGDHFVSLGA
jgi:hypothetical protein